MPETYCQRPIARDPFCHTAHTVSAPLSPPLSPLLAPRLTSSVLRVSLLQDLGPNVLQLDAADPSALTFTPPNGAKAVHCTLDAQQQRDLIVLLAKAFASLAAEPSFEQKCRVWEGDGYGDYYGQIFGNVMLLFEGGEAPADGVEPSEALMLHGCKVRISPHLAHISQSSPISANISPSVTFAHLCHQLRTCSSGGRLRTSMPRARMMMAQSSPLLTRVHPLSSPMPPWLRVHPELALL